MSIMEKAGIENSKELDEVDIPTGIYEAIIQTTKLRDVPEGRMNAGEQEVLWIFRLDDDSQPSLKGIAVFENTIVAKGKSRKFKSFVRALDMNEEKFDEGDADNVRCKIHVEQYTYTRKSDNEQVQGHRVREVFGL